MSSFGILRALVLVMSTLALVIPSSQGAAVYACNSTMSPCDLKACSDYCKTQPLYGECAQAAEPAATVVAECCCVTGINDPPAKLPTKLCSKTARTSPCDQRVCNEHCQSQPLAGRCVEGNGSTSCCCALTD